MTEETPAQEYQSNDQPSKEQIQTLEELSQNTINEIYKPQVDKFLQSRAETFMWGVGNNQMHLIWENCIVGSGNTMELAILNASQRDWPDHNAPVVLGK